MAVKNRQKQPTYEDYALATTPAEDVIHGTPTLKYDYSQLDPAIATIVQDKARTIKRAERRSVETMIQIGRDLQVIQDNFPHGMFLPWLAEEFGWSQTMAYNLINLAERFPTSADVPAIGLTALYKLTSSSTPASALDEATARANAGETITVTTAAEIANKHKATNPKPPPITQQQIYTPTTPTPDRGTSSNPAIQHLRLALAHLHDARNKARGNTPESQLESVNNLIANLLRTIQGFEQL